MSACLQRPQSPCPAVHLMYQSAAFPSHLQLNAPTPPSIPASWLLPSGHRVHELEFEVGLKDFTSHCVHTLLPVDAAYSPGRHSSHATARSLPENCPAAQSSQWVVEVAFFPASHFVHALVPLDAVYSPGWQSSHATARSLPEKRPRGQSSQCVVEAEVLPAMHASHLRCPTDCTNSPAGHSVHEGALSSSVKRPCSQAVQTVTPPIE